MPPPSFNEPVFLVCDGSQRSRAPSAISSEGLRRLSRMLPANHEQLIHNRLKNKHINT
ncbi:hypothetical protein KIN20_004324 [Parelaphostrongylus tenuis]|uniref:Uncharacterized protein n=1 Tax=Parelaphostrongylus tenuis TaxID=148309 RepID=A0AAD5LYM0_PARTN|nr:hypothetical protein KIN20_004324 [Parelaphostrongylus tenuis]